MVRVVFDKEKETTRADWMLRYELKMRGSLKCLESDCDIRCETIY